MDSRLGEYDATLAAYDAKLAAYEATLAAYESTASNTVTEMAELKTLVNNWSRKIVIWQHKSARQQRRVSASAVPAWC